MQRCCKVKRYASLFFRQKNRRTKEGIENQMLIQASLMFGCSFMLLHLRCWVYDYFCWKEQKGLLYCIRPLCRHSWLGLGIWWWRTVGRVLCRWQLCSHWDKIPGPSQGWRCRRHVWSATSQGKTRINPLGKMRACSQVKRGAELLLVKTLR